MVVIGSGYGGGVAASRMARGRQSVCILEMGREKWPGEFPESLDDAIKEVHVSGELAPGDRRGKEGKQVDRGNPIGLYHMVVGDGQNAYVGNGLGGTSLLNANVFLEATPKVLEMEIWPEELRGSPEWEKCKQALIFLFNHPAPGDSVNLLTQYLQITIVLALFYNRPSIRKTSHLYPS